MRYDDASQGSVADHVSAHDDTAHLAGNDYGQTTGNIITGTGTVSGVAGADVSGPGAHITAISGAGGSDTSFDAQGHLQVAGQYGTLTIDANGNYAYARNAGSPEGVSDTFTYTLADAAGSSDQAKLVIAIGNPPILNAQGSQTIQTANGVVVLPAGVELSDVHVEGRNLVITLPDGSTMVIPDGAVFVPQLVVNGVEVPASNLAALLIDSEPKPAAGDQSPNQLSSGGNFEVPVAPLDPGVPLGDLIPPTELNYIPPEFHDLFPDEHNQAPSIGLSSVNVSEESVSVIAPPIADNSGNPDTTNDHIVPGHIDVSDPDGDALTVTLDTAGLPTDLKSQGVTITWALSPDGHTVTGSAGGNTVITIAIENDGDYLVTLVRPVDHPTGGGEQGTSFVIPVSVSDGQETTGGGAITVTIEDDSPVVSGVQARGGVTLDETNAVPGGFPISDTSSTSVIVNSTGGFGADGPAASGSITYGLGLTGGVSSLSSGIVTAVGDHPITLVQIDSDTIEGQYTDGGSHVAFTIQMNANGTVTLTQNVALEHNVDGPPGPAHDDSLNLNGLVNATVIYKDFDGDTASGAAPIGGSLIFKDDGPSAAINPQAALDTIVLDETRPVGSDTTGAGSPSGLASATANFADNFVAPVHYGADGAGSVAYTLSLSSNGIGSGLYALDASDTSAGDGDGIGQGAEITLSQTGNTITGSAGGVDYFTISIDSNTGVVTFTQLHAIWHPTAGSSYDEAAQLNTDAAANVSVVQTVTDSDGDTATASLGIGRGVFSIQDDGPTAAVDPQATLDTVVLDESRPAGSDTAGAGAPGGLASATANFGDNFVAPATHYGADGPGSTSFALHLSSNGIGSGLYALDASDTTAGDGDGIGQGAEITLSQVGNVITGSAGGTDYFTISIDPSTGVVTFSQLSPIWHPTPGASYDEAANLSTAAAADVQVVQTVTDADGDTASASLNIGQSVFSIQDDGPVAGVNPEATLDTIVLDESTPGTDTAGASAPNGLASATANFGDNFSAVPDYGSDGPGHASYQLLLSANGIGSGLYALDASDTTLGDGDGIGQGAEITLSQVGNVITGSAGGTDYFTISIDSNTGVVTFTQLSPIWHSNTGSFDEAAALNTAAAANVQVQQTLTDADGDTSSATVNVGQGVFSIQDDGPVSSVNGQAALDTIVLDESRPVGTDTSGAGSPSGLDTATANFSDNFSGPTDYGSDGAGHTSYALHLSAGSVGSGLYALQPSDTSLAGVDGDGFGQGAQIMMTQVGNVITGSAGGVDYFTISINASTGVVTFTQLQPIWNPTPGASYDEAAALSTAAAADLQVVQSVTDADGDTASSSLNIGQGVFSIQDDGPVAVNDGNIATLNDNASGVSIGSVDTLLLANDDFGSDGPAGNHGAITFSAGSLGGTVTVDGSGNLIYTSNHDTAPGNTDVETFTYTVRDADGDTTTATFTVSLTESGPSIGTTAFTVDEDGLPNGIAGTVYVDGSDVAGQATTASGTLTGFSFGGDGQGATGNIVLAASADTGLRTLSGGIVETVWNAATHTLTGYVDTDNSNTLNGAETAVFTLQIDDVANGHYTFSLLQPVQHATANTEDDKLLSVNVTVTDSDGDPANGVINVTIDDDSPQVSNVAGGASVTIDETTAVTPAGFPISANSGTAVITATTAFGADGQAAAGATVYGLSLNGGVNTIASTLQTAVGDFPITLNLVDSTHITGTYNGANVAFTITMNANTGVVTVQQNVALEHLDDGGPGHYNDALDLVVDGAGGANLVNATITIKDGDGDTHSGSTPIGDQITFLDDGPSIDVTATNESNTVLTTQDHDTIGVATDTDTSTANFSGVFGRTFSGGADGAAATPVINYDLSVLSSVSGLASHGVAINLYELANGVIVGSTALSAPALETDSSVVFSVAVAADGTVTLKQYQQIDHTVEASPVPGTGSPFDDQFAVLANGKIQLTGSATVTDNDGDTATDSASIDLGGNIRFADDGPTAVNDSANQATENSAVTIDIFANDSAGADGVNLVGGVSLVGGTLTGTGSLVYNGDGTFSYTPGAGEEGSITFTYKLTDFDGDTSTATATINLKPDSVPGPVDSVAKVDDDGLTNGNAASTTGDIDANVGEAATANPSEAIWHGQLSATSGNDTITNYTFSAMGGTSGTVGTETVNYTWDNATSTLTATVSGGARNNLELFHVVINQATGEYNLTLVNPVMHAAGGNETSAPLVPLTFSVTDSDGDHANGTVNVTFNDDMPTAVSAQAIVALDGLNNVAGSTKTVSLDTGDHNVVNNFGADGGKVIFDAASTTALQNYHFAHAGVELTYVISPDGQTITGSAGALPVLTIQLQTGGGSDYTVTMNNTIDTLSTTTFDDLNFDFVGGNGSWAGFTSGTNGDGITDLLLTPMVGGVNSSTMNTNANEGGVGSGNSVELGEGVRVDTVSDLQALPAPQASADYGTVANQNHVFGQHVNVLGISGLISTVVGNSSSTTDVSLIARDEAGASDLNDHVGDGAHEEITKVVLVHGASTITVVKANAGDTGPHVVNLDGHSVTVTFTAGGDATVTSILEGTRVGAFTADGFDSLEIRNIGGSNFKIGAFQTLSATNSPVDMSVPISITDNDGDVLSSGNLVIHVNAGPPPVVLDLNGDGVHFLGQDAGVQFDYGAGLVSTAWAASDDGILVRDANHDGNVSGSEMVFGGNGVTDMEALHAQYGAQLDANDADFTQFAVWNDANSNGVVDASELHSLAEAGITSINLVSDGVAYTAANGDVSVAGSSSFTRADGSTGTAADASFATGAAKATQEVERVAANSNNVALAAAVAAAGIAASSAAAASAPSFGAGETAITAAIVGKSAFVASDSFDGGHHFSALSALSSGGFEANSLQLASTSHTAIAASNIGELTSTFSMAGGAPTALLDATDFSNIVSAQPMAVGMNVAMPSLHGLVAGASGIEAQASALNVQHAGTVQQIVADALHGGSAGQDINALLNVLPGAGLGEVAGLHGLASPVGNDVSTWDTGHHGDFTFGVADLMTNPAMVLHHDAVQPVANG